MTQEYVLLLVDPQPRFISAQAPALDHMLREIELAKMQTCPIFILSTPYFSAFEEEGCGPVHEVLRKAVENYPLYGSIEKYISAYVEFGAATQVINACQKLALGRPWRFRVGGAYTGGWLRENGRIKSDNGEQIYTGCVFDLVLGLRKLSSDAIIDVVREACHEPRKWFDVRWEDFSELPQVFLTPAQMAVS